MTAVVYIVHLSLRCSRENFMYMMRAATCTTGCSCHPFSPASEPQTVSDIHAKPCRTAMEPSMRRWAFLAC